MIIGILSLTAYSLLINTSRQSASPIIRIIDSKTGIQSISLGSPTEPMPREGFSFTVNVTLNELAPKLYTYQIGVEFDKNIIRCTGASIPKKDPNFVFYGKTVQTVRPDIGDITPEIGYVTIGASLVNPADAKDVSQGILCQINFTVIKTGTTTIKIIPTTEDSRSPYYGHDTFLWELRDSDLRYINYSSESFSVTILAEKTPPVASFSFNPKNPKSNQTVTFDASASYDPDGEIVLYHWDFGDGTNETSDSPTVTHVFGRNGLYQVNLTVYDNDGLSDFAVEIVLVGNLPIANFTYEPKENILASTTVTFDASASYDPDGEIVLYHWDFGDGTNETSDSPTVTHVFGRNGLFTVKLTVYDNDTLSNSTSKVLMVGIPPRADFTFSPEFPAVNETVVFDASLSSDDDGYIVLLVWNFGEFLDEFFEVDVTDPSNPEPFKAYYNYSAGGAYPVTLTVYDNDGLYSSVVHVVNVTLTGESSVGGGEITPYVVTVVIIGGILIAVIWNRRRPEKELDKRYRYRVI